MVTVEGVAVPVEQLIAVKVHKALSNGRCAKDMKTAYLLLFATGLFGAHHFYLERLLHGCLAVPQRFPIEMLTLRPSPGSLVGN